MSVWFSVAIRIGIVVADEPTEESRSIVLLRAEDFDDALGRALEAGHGLEHEYDNADGLRVRHVLVQIETVDELGEEIEDGREVYAEPAVLRPPDEERPPLEQSRPTQSGV